LAVRFGPCSIAGRTGFIGKTAGKLGNGAIGGDFPRVQQSCAGRWARYRSCVQGTNDCSAKGSFPHWGKKLDSTPAWGTLYFEIFGLPNFMWHKACQIE